MPPTPQAAKEYLAYAFARTGHFLHPECWDAYMETRADYDAQGRRHAVGFMGDLIYNTRKGEHLLKGCLCAQCNKPFKAHP